jgi:hypothetical protein
MVDGVRLVREKEGHIHSSGLYDARAKGAKDIIDDVAVVVCAYCNRWWWAPTADVLRPGNGSCAGTKKRG